MLELGLPKLFCYVRLYSSCGGCAYQLDDCCWARVTQVDGFTSVVAPCVPCQYLLPDAFECTF